MMLVDRPELVPGQCVVNLSADDPGGYVYLGERPWIDPSIYVSRQAVIDMGREFGFPSPDEIHTLRLQLADAETELARVSAENVQLNRDVEAAEWTLERQFGAKIQNKPGRPRKGSTSA